MGWLYVPGLPASTLGYQSWTHNTEPSVTWRGKVMPLPHWQRAWSKAPWIRVLSGMTLPLSTADDGVDSWILSTLGSRANPIPLSENKRENPTNVISGRSSSESSTKSVLPWCFSRMSQTSFSGFDVSERNYSYWVTGLKLEYSVRQKSAPATKGNAFSFWPTASARDWKDTDGMAETGTNPDGSKRNRLDQLPRAVFHFFRQVQQAKTGRGSSSYGQNSHRLRLNPNFVDWLMGFRPGWTFTSIAFARAETQSYLCRQRSHLSLLLRNSD